MHEHDNLSLRSIDTLGMSEASMSKKLVASNAGKKAGADEAQMPPLEIINAFDAAELSALYVQSSQLSSEVRSPSLNPSPAGAALGRVEREREMLA